MMIPWQVATGVVIVGFIIGCMSGWFIGMADSRDKQNARYDEGFNCGKHEGNAQGYQTGVEYGQAHPKRDSKGHFEKLNQ